MNKVDFVKVKCDPRDGKVIEVRVYFTDKTCQVVEEKKIF